MKRIASLLLFFLLACVCHATTITGTVITQTTAASPGYIVFHLFCPPYGNCPQYVTNEVQFKLTSQGQMPAGAAILANSNLPVKDTYYVEDIYDANFTLLAYQNVIIIGDIVDINHLALYNPLPIPTTYDYSGLDPLIPSTLYGYAPTNGGGLVLNVASGNSLCGSPPSYNFYNAGTITLTASSTNYVSLSPLSCSPQFNTTGFTAGAIPIAVVTTGSSSISLITDARTWFNTSIASSSSSSPAAPQGALQYYNSGSFGASTFLFTPSTCNIFAGANITSCDQISLPTATQGCIVSLPLSGDPTPTDPDAFGNYLNYCRFTASKEGSLLYVGALNTQAASSNWPIQVTETTDGLTSCSSPSCTGGGILLIVGDNPAFDGGTGVSYHGIDIWPQITRSSGSLANFTGINIASPSIFATGGGSPGAETLTSVYGIHISDLLNKGTTTTALAIDSQTGGFAINAAGTSQFGNLQWTSGGANLGIFSQSNTANRTYSFPNATGGVRAHNFVASAVTNANSGIGTVGSPVQLIASTPTTGFYPVWLYMVPTRAGVGCSGSEAVVLNLEWPSPAANTVVEQTLGQMTITNNGIVDNYEMSQNGMPVINSGQTLGYYVNIVTPLTGCSTQPQYQVFLDYEQ